MPSLTDSFRARIKAFRRELPLVAQGKPEGLHRARVASRRLRELIPILGFDAHTARKLRKRLRKVTTGLGRVREIDVLVALLADRSSDSADSRALVTVSAAVARARSRTREWLDEELPTAKLERLADVLERAAHDIPHLDARTPADARTKRWALEARVARRASQLQSAIQDAGALYASERLHDVRIALKKFRYTAELLVRGGRVHLAAADTAELKQVQNLLGQIQDREALIAWTRHVQASAPPEISLWRELADLEHALADECRAYHGRFIRRRERLLAILERHTVVPHRNRRSVA